ncbi:MAG: hypothetical protein WC505_01295 [Patescibacteria group bacterium]
MKTQLKSQFANWLVGVIMALLTALIPSTIWFFIADSTPWWHCFRWVAGCLVMIVTIILVPEFIKVIWKHGNQGAGAQQKG